MKKNLKMVLIALYVALAISLDFVKELIPFLNMPKGGSINIALIPIVLCSFHLGPVDGALAGFLWWLITSLMGLNSWFIHVPQYIADYIIPSVIVGLASIFYKKKNIFELEAGILLVMIIRTLSVIISGVYFWAEEAAGSFATWAYSLSYNLPYSIATTIMLMVIIPIILKALKTRM